jgi:tetratricopeptide (TPR) repeat protein
MSGKTRWVLVGAALVLTIGAALVVLTRPQDNSDEESSSSFAERLAERNVALKVRTLGPNTLSEAVSLMTLADLYRNNGKYAQAEPLYLRALTIRSHNLGSGHPGVAKCLIHMAVLYQMQKKYPEAESLYQRAIAIAEKASSLPTLTMALYSYSDLLRRSNREQEAEQLEARATGLRSKATRPIPTSIAER